MRIERELGVDASPTPFLTVVTRCYQRPTFLEANVQSLREQTDADYEHVLIVDETGVGLHKANQAVATVEPRGEYVLILDDDDKLTEPEAIALLKEAVTPDDPALLFFKADHDKLGVLPDGVVWGKRPIHGRVGSCDFITRRDVWERHIAAFGAPHSGDYHYLKSVWSDAPSVAWLDRQLAAVQRISNGRPE